MPFSTVGTEVRARSVAPICTAAIPSKRGDGIGQPLRLFRQSFDTKRGDGGSFAPPRPGRHDAAAANEVAELRHDALRPGRRRVETRQIGGAVEHLGRFQFVEDEEAVDVGAVGAEYANARNPLVVTRSVVCSRVSQ